MILAVVQSSAVLVMAFVIAGLLRRQSAAIRHLVLTAGLIGALMAPLAGRLFPRDAARRGIYIRVQDQTEILLNLTAGINPAPATAPEHRATRSNYPGYLSVWAGGIAVMALFLVAGWTRVLFLLRRSRAIANGSWADSRERISKRLRVSRAVRLVQTERPVLGTWGLLRPRILLPRDAITWPENRIGAVITHELAHIKRFDWPVQILAELALAVYWFNPLFWLLCRRLRIESEYACDDIVLNAGMEPADYAAHLLDLARLLKNSGRAWSPVLAMAYPPSLERRFVAMLNPSLNRKPAGVKTGLIAWTAVLALTIPIAAMQAPEGKPALLTSAVLPAPAPVTQPEPAAPAVKPAIKRTVKEVAAKPVEVQGRADGSLAGTVTDSTGAVIPGVTVTVSSMKQQGASVLETPIETTVTNEIGNFELRALQEGSYGLKAELPGFVTARREWLQIAPSQQLVENLTMAIGAISQQVIVTAVGTPRPKAASGVPQRIRVGGNVIAANLVSQVKPVYPQSARDAGIEGKVTLQGLIGADGTLLGLTPLNNVDRDLTKAALEAVKQWRYRPTLLNGEPVEVLTTIGVEFKLSQ
jgi:TonB family protein